MLVKSIELSAEGAAVGVEAREGNQATESDDGTGGVGDGRGGKSEDSAETGSVAASSAACNAAVRAASLRLDGAGFPGEASEDSADGMVAGVETVVVTGRSEKTIVPPGPDRRPGAIFAPPPTFEEEGCGEGPGRRGLPGPLCG